MYLGAKMSFSAHFRSKRYFFAKFTKFRISRTRARRGRKPYIILAYFNDVGRSKSRKSAFGARIHLFAPEVPRFPPKVTFGGKRCTSVPKWHFWRPGRLWCPDGLSPWG